MNIRQIVFFLSAMGIAAGVTTSCHRDGSGTPAPMEETVNTGKRIQQDLETVSDIRHDLKDIGPATPEEAVEMRALFGDFKQAVLSYDGKKAAAMMAEPSLKYYDLHLAIARLKLFRPDEYKPIEEDLSATIHATVELMTERLSATYIKTATPQQLYETAFSQGWIGYNTISTASIDNIHAYNNRGVRYLTGDFYYAGTFKDKRVLRIGFVKENGTWKVDLLPIFIDLNKTVEFFIFREQLDREGTIQNSVELTNESFKPENWQPSVQKQDTFSVNFPRAPLYGENDGEHIYTSRDYRYGQFDVRVRYYEQEDASSPYYAKAARDADLLSFLKALGAESPQCTQHVIATDTMLKCDFDVPEHDSKGKAVWIFTKDRRYLLFNLARKDQYDDEAAALYMQSFSYGQAQTP